MKKKMIIILFLITIFLPIDVNAQRGCCSWHSGESGSYNTTTGMEICNDGTDSPSCVGNYTVRENYLKKLEKQRKEEEKRNTIIVFLVLGGLMASPFIILPITLRGVKAPINNQQTNQILCPICGSKMTIRVGRYGRFYGCTRYPYCKGTRKIK